MLLTVLAFFYITFCCWCCGIELLSIIRRPSPFAVDRPTQPFIITCFLGLAFIGSLLTVASLFAPITSWHFQVALFVPVITTLIKKRHSFISMLKKAAKGIMNCPVPVLAALLAGILVVLVMHAWIINHPDTIAYHSQNILWIENYKAVPGVANLQLTYGIQSSWFTLAGFFSLPFLQHNALTFINATVLIWFVIFICQQLYYSLRKENNTGIANGLLCLLFLAFSFWSYTQIRLTATSASPDFIATLYIWLIIYLFIRNFKKGDTYVYSLIVFLSFFAVTIKLSALPCLLFGLYVWFRYSNKTFLQKILGPLSLGILVLGPALARNVISTGYLLFPSSFPDWFSYDWKVPASSVAETQQYITAYARTNVTYNEAAISAVLKMKLTEWLPIWWGLRSLPDKILLIGLSVMLLAIVVFYKKLFIRRNEPLLVALIFSLLGIIFWFIQAPDPRFGFGFIIPFIFIGGQLLLNRGEKVVEIKKPVLNFGIMLFAVATFSYAGFRFAHYSNTNTLKVPAGIPAVRYNTIVCGDSIHVPVDNVDCGITPVPCTHTDCNNFMPRGKKIEDGFRPAR